MPALAEQAGTVAEYQEMFSRLSSMVDSSGMSPQKMVTGSWLGMKYFAPIEGRMGCNHGWFTDAGSRGQAAVSGLFLAMHGDNRMRLFVRNELETNLTKRQWLWLTVGTEDVFFRQFENGRKMQPLMSVLPSMAGLRAQCRLLMQSRDPLTRRAGLFWGSWVADAAYLWGVNYMAKEDKDPVNRACATRLLTMIR
jgi:hypothetical protein